MTMWPRPVKLSVALDSPKWDHHLGVLLNNLFRRWNDWWVGIRWQRCRAEWSRVGSSGGSPISGSAPIVPWFISTAPQRPRGGDLSVSRLCVQEDELGLQTHRTETLSLSVVFSPLHSPTFLFLSLLCKLSSFPYSLNLHSFHHSSSFPPDISCSPWSFCDMEAACRDDLWAH